MTNPPNLKISVTCRYADPWRALGGPNWSRVLVGLTAGAQPTASTVVTQLTRTNEKLARSDSLTDKAEHQGLVPARRCVGAGSPSRKGDSHSPAIDTAPGLMTPAELQSLRADCMADDIDIPWPDAQHWTEVWN